MKHQRGAKGVELEIHKLQGGAQPARYGGFHQI
ncbi:Uncharacterised protein [Enterobacter cloacae]|nr:Uncharacterised protein [Enterobacter cloacae]